MKRPVLRACAFAALLSAGLASSPASAAPLTAVSKINAVTVYSDRAVITRTAPLELPATGIYEVRFEKLPPTIIDESITVSGKGAAQVTILDVTGHEERMPETTNERLKAIQEELKALQKQKRALDDRANVLKAQEASLAKLEAASTSAPTRDSAPRLSIEESMKLLTFLEEQRTKLAAERHALDAALEELGAKIAAADWKHAELRNGGASGQAQVGITVRLEAATTGKLELALTYAASGASWQPHYDVRATPAERSVALGYFGVVQQNTGEDWTDIALTLSTARPALGGAAPEIRPWALDVYRPVVAMPTAAAGAVQLSAFEVRSQSGAYAPSATALGRTAAEPQAKLDQFAVNAAATVGTATTSAVFKIAAAASVPSDNSPQKIPITTATFKAAPEYLTVPKKLAAAFLTSKVVNSSDFPLLAGPMNVFLDGTFVASGALKTVMPGEKFDLSLGADEGISVKHKRVNRFAEDTGLTNSGKRVTYEYVVTIQNNKRTSERVVVADHVPVSRHEKIVVKLLAPAEKELKPANDGTLKWTLDLKPGEKRELTLKFSVDYPNEIAVTGLES